VHALLASDGCVLLPLAQLSLAPLVRSSDAPGGGSVVLNGGFWTARIDKRGALLLTSLLDLLACVLVAGGIQYARGDLSRFALAAEAATAELRDFSVLLRGLPHDRRLRGEEVGAYLEAAVPGLKGSVVAVTVSRDVGAQLLALRVLHAAHEVRMAQTPEQRQRQREREADDEDEEAGCAAKQRIKRHAALLALRAQAHAFDEGAAPVLGAYVTLDTVAARVVAQQALPRAAMARMRGVLCCTAPRRFRAAHRLTCVQAPDPANVLWCACAL
jgi:hypothetical protein